MRAFIQPMSDRLLPSLAALEVEAIAEGFSMLSRLRSRWSSGAERFQGVGEVMYVASQGGPAVATAGLTRDPYLDDPAVGRVRHVYVTKAERRAGLGRTMVWSVLNDAVLHFDVVRLRSDRAAEFYEALGFERTDEEGATHRLDLQSAIGDQLRAEIAAAEDIRRLADQ